MTIEDLHLELLHLQGIERILGAAQNFEPQMLEVTAGQAKYEHVHHGIVWRIPRLPKEGQGAYTEQKLSLKLPLTTFDQMPDSFQDFCMVEYFMPSTVVSHTTLRSISVNPLHDDEKPPEKYVRYLAKYEYRVEMNMNVNLDHVAPVVPIPAAVEEAKEEESDEDEDEDEDEEEEEDEE